jgi:hypothetical protein
MMDHQRMSKSPSPIQFRRLLWVGPLTVVASVVAVLIIRVIAVALLKPPPEFMPLSWGSPIFFSAILVTGAVLIFALLVRFSSNPIRIFQIIAVVFLLLSFIPDIALATSEMPGANWLTALALMSMHVAAWAVSVGLLTKLTRKA